MNSPSSMQFKITAQNNKAESSKRNILIYCLISFALFAGITGFVQSLLSMHMALILLLIGLLFIVSEHLLCQNKKLFKIGNLILAVTYAVLFIVLFKKLMQGFLILSNTVLKTIEKYLPYKFEELAVTVKSSEAQVCLYVCMIALAILISMLCVYLARRRNIIVLILLFLLFTFIQVILGTSPSILWNAVLYTSFVFLTIHYHIQNKNSKATGSQKSLVSIQFCVIFSVIALIILSVTNFIIPAKSYEGNASVQMAAQSIRIPVENWLESKWYNAGLMSYADKEKEKPKTDTEELTEPVDGYIDGYQPANVAQSNDDTPSLIKEDKASPWKTVISVVLPIILLILVIAVLRKRRIDNKRSKNFSNPDRSFAINQMFIYTMDLIKAYGLELNDLMFRKYTDKLSKMFSKKYSQEYLEVIDLWHEATYSNHDMTKEQKKKAEKFMIKTRQTLLNNSSFTKRLKIKYYYCL